MNATILEFLVVVFKIMGAGVAVNIFSYFIGYFFTNGCMNYLEKHPLVIKIRKEDDNAKS